MNSQIVREGRPAALQANPGLQADAEWPRATYAWYVVVILLLCQICSFIDRQIVNLFLDPIRQDLRLTDTQVSLVTGFAFAMFYATLGIPLARLADESNRKRIILAGVAVWSVMTAFTGLSRGFWHLLGARMGVGAGEATLSPSAFSMLSDYFPREKLSRAISIYSTGAYFGMAVAMFAGGSIATLGATASIPGFPQLGRFETWQLAFFFAAALGAPLTVLLFTVREPLRRGADATYAAGDRSPSSFKALRSFVSLNRSTFVGLLIAFPFYCMANAALLLWAPTFFMRTYGMAPATVGWVYGAILLVFGAGGVFASGYCADRYTQAGRLDGPVRVAMYGAIATIPFAILTPLMPTPTLALVAMCGLVFFVGGPATLGFTALPMMTPNRLRAQITAVYFLFMNLMTGFAPVIVGMMTDYVVRDPKGLRYSLAIVPACYLVISVVAFARTLKPYSETIVRLTGQPREAQ